MSVAGVLLNDYEKARLLKGYIAGIREAYTRDFTNEDLTKRQVAVAIYLIDRLALKAGNEKEYDDDKADTIGCCTLKVEHVKSQPPNILKFDFISKDSIRYCNHVMVELPVFNAIQEFQTGKKGNEDLLDKVDTSTLNAHLNELMPGLTAKVFRTYTANIILDLMINNHMMGRARINENLAVYNYANKEVAIIFNHQRSVLSSHSSQMKRLIEKIEEVKGFVEELKTDLGRALKGESPLKGSDGKPKRNLSSEVIKKKIDRINVRIKEMEWDKKMKEGLKTFALGTSKINYFDPRISVAWCKRRKVPIEKIFSKSLMARFDWSMDVDPSFRF